MDKVHSVGISYPKLIKHGNNFLCSFEIDNVNIRSCVQEYINGENLALLNYDPNFDEVKEISRQASIINSIDCNYDYFERDTWATRNFLEQYPVKRKALYEHENSLVEPLVEKFEKLNIAKLPCSFVHGDMIHTNVMKDQQGKIWIIDFGVAKYQPRIIELAVLFHDLFIDLNSRDNTMKKRELALKEYQKKIQLSQIELDALPVLINVTHAMYLMSSAYMERIIKERTEETSYWLKRSEESLIESLG
jgi:Ser/Thr protein kinase RdoA (MazF antagonist)